MKWLLRHIKGSVEAGLKFGDNSGKSVIIGYVDSDFVGDLDKRKSTTGYIFTMCGGPISWKSKLQAIVALNYRIRIYSHYLSY